MLSPLHALPHARFGDFPCEITKQGPDLIRLAYSP
jgi:hypothetical protein